MSEYIVEMHNISKEFPGVKALDNANLKLESGKVMALLGENGAGKSTLMKILSGVYTRDSGEIKVNGNVINNLNSNIAEKLGIAIIHQELNMCTHLSVAENIFLGREKSSAGVLSEKLMNAESKKILDKLNIDISPNTVVGDLSVSQQQMVEIAKALSANAKILIMDEPTSALSSKEIDRLFTIINNLKAEGCSIVYISHRFAELEHIVDQITIMRDGKYITSCDFKDITIDEIITHMVGREIKEKFPRCTCEVGKKIFSVKNLNAGKLVQDINFELFEGEIVGLAGLMGAGRTEITRAIFGADPKDSGELILDGKEIKISKPIDAINSGVALIPEDRKKDGLCIRLPVKDNLALPNLDSLGKKIGVVNKKLENVLVSDAIKNLKIRLANAEVNAGSLSGGNQQKIVVGKWLARNSRVVIFDEPTRGIDVAAKVEIYNLMNSLKKEGVAVLFVSSELPEVLGIADRILVICEGRITGELDIKDATQEKILEYATRFQYKIS